MIAQLPEDYGEEGRAMIDLLLNVPLTIHPMATVLKLAYDQGLGPKPATVYDCCYLATAISLSCRVVTADRMFHDAFINGPFGGHLIWVADPL